MNAKILNAYRSIRLMRSNLDFESYPSVLDVCFLRNEIFPSVEKTSLEESIDSLSR